MDYKEKYEQALKKAKAYDNVRDKIAIRFGSNVAKEIFSEYEENEDEKIRKGLIDFLKSPFVNENITDEKVTPWIAWLEKHGDKTHEEKVDEAMREIEEKARAFSDKHKGESSDDILAQMRGEQNLADKVEPKFKAGDWVVWDNKVVCNITGYIIKGGKKPLMYIITDTNGMERTYSVNGFDNNARLWDITKDAKDGDVLATHLSPEGDWIGIYKESVDILGFKTYCFLNGVGEFVINPNRCRNHGTHGLHPATKEQCDILFSKMKEAGYEWLDKDRKLIKITQ